MLKLARRFRRDERGLSMTEAILVFPVVLLVITAFVEFGYAVFQWNQTVKATQLGARLAAVSDPVITDLSSISGDLLSDDVGVGVPPTDGSGNLLAVSCGGTSGTACEPNGMNRMIFGSDGKCDPDYTGDFLNGDSSAGITAGMCDLNPQITTENIRVTYHRTGLGYYGRPGNANGLVMTITIATDGVTFDLPLLGALLGINNLAIPAHPVSVTSEDFTSCRTTCGS
jgi:hypothetical protein